MREIKSHQNPLRKKKGKGRGGKASCNRLVLGGKKKKKMDAQKREVRSPVVPRKTVQA